MNADEFEKRLEPILLALVELERDLEREVENIHGTWEYLDVAQFALQRLLDPGGEVMSKLQALHSIRVP
jgi:hypothetical protein